MAFQSTLPFDTTAASAEALERARAEALALSRTLPPRAGHWDELRDACGALREPWRRFFAVLGEDGIADLAHRLASVAQQVRDNDITYNVFADNGKPRPWSLDLLPFLIEEAEWAQIERGVAQRARLVNAIVADVYGPQTLLARALLPPALVFGHPGYLRAVKGYTPPNGQYLQIVSVDIARGPDGGWTVLSHRADAPSGLGYALENRLIVASLLAEPFRAMHVARLAPGYSKLIETLAQAARETMRDGEGEAALASPHMALLTPGPYSETYFEHAFLARYLGLTLVEGKDLTVRDDKLYLKTLDGLERVHAVLRRLDDAYCDPVELRADSTLGVPGLLQVMRAGNVIVSNVPGASFAESPAVQGFLPAICEALLGETLVLPTVPTWWCGEAAAREEAFEQLTEAFLVPTWPGRHADAPPGVRGGVQTLADWQARIEAASDGFTIQQPLQYSIAPRYEEGAFGGRPSVLRVYAIVGPDGQWSVLPGAFTRLAAERHATVSMQFGGSSADTWVLSSQPSTPFSLRPAPLKVGDLARHHRTVSSRAAENLFWAGRYSERAENNVRLARLILGSIDGADAADEMFATYTELAAQCGLIPSVDTLARSSPQAFERLLVAGMGEDPGATGIAQNLASLAYACGEVRGRLANDHWRTVLACRNDFRDAAAKAGVTGAVGRYDRVALLDALEQLATQLCANSGAQGDRMTRDEAWRLLFVGRHIERVATMATFLRVVAEAGTLTTPAGFDLLLQLFDSTLTYRALYPGRFEVLPLIDLLVVEPTNPRGVYGVYARLRKKLDEIAAAAGGARRMPFAALLPPVESLPSLEALSVTDGARRYVALAQLCEQLCDLMTTASNEVSGRYFSHANTLSAQVSS